MDQTLHLGDEVEIATDDFAELGVPRGAVGIIVDDWADGSKDIEVTDPATGDRISRSRMAAHQIRPNIGPLRPRESREHGVLFGRGDPLADDVEEPPTSFPIGMGAIEIPGYAPARIAFKDPPTEPVILDDDLPWELRDAPPEAPKPQSGPILI